MEAHMFLDATTNSCDFASADHVIGALHTIWNIVLVVLKKSIIKMIWYNYLLEWFQTTVFPNIRLQDNMTAFVIAFHLN